ncbi:MAG: caspase family protein [Opitutaceae bacterium]|nr:caspase family protein [Opitutaceae bacterium]
MKRKAVLIESSNVSGQKDLPGARVDVANWRNFLTSPLGGAWADNEIVVLHKPFSSDVEAAVKVDSDCYCFVTFSGHGEDGSVVLNEHRDDFPVSKLRPTGERGVVVVDSCRGVSSVRYNFSNKAAALANIAEGTMVTLNASLGRASQFEQAIANRAYVGNQRESTWASGFSSYYKGVVEMLACAKGQGAEEDPTAGGYYTSLLLASADVWNKTKTGSKIYSTKEAHDYAASLLSPQQTPEYSPTWLAYPFAVKS